MSNDYNEKGEAGELEQKVKGNKSDAGASFKPFSNPGGVGDEAAQSLNKTGVAMPQESEKHLPKAGGKVS